MDPSSQIEQLFAEVSVTKSIYLYGFFILSSSIPQLNRVCMK